MRMTYLTPIRKRKKKNDFFLHPAFIVFAICFIISIFFFSGASRAVIYMANGMRNFLDRIPLVAYFESKAALSEENAALKMQIQQALSSQGVTAALQNENATLKASLGKRVEQTLDANVIENPGFSPYDTLVLNKGTDDGVAVGNKIFYGSLVIGEVIEADSAISRAELFSTPGKTFQAKIGSEKIEAEAEGQGGGSFVILLPKAVSVSKGDPIFLPEESSKVFGFISGVSSDETNPFQKVFFTLPVNPFQIDEVSIKI